MNSCFHWNTIEESRQSVEEKHDSENTVSAKIEKKNLSENVLQANGNTIV